MSSSWKKTDDAKVFHVTGTLTLHGVSKEITVPVTYNGQGTDPWKNERIGFDAAFSIKRSDYGITYGEGLIGEEIKFIFSVEGIKKEVNFAVRHPRMIQLCYREAIDLRG